MNIHKFIYIAILLSFTPVYAGDSLYLDLIRRCLGDRVYKDVSDKRPNPMEPPKVEELATFDGSCKVQWSLDYNASHSLLNLMDDVVANNIEGDFIETGVWRGGVCIYMRAYLKDKGITNRKVWVADSFAGVPPPTYEQDKGLDLYKVDWLAVPLETVKNNFKCYGLLDDQVVFLKGWFKDTLHVAPIDKLAIIRLDGDLYESTMDALTALYDKVSVGGYIIIDDYGAIPACAQAVTDFRNSRNIDDPIVQVNWTEHYWKKTH